MGQPLLDACLRAAVGKGSRLPLKAASGTPDDLSKRELTRRTADRYLTAAADQQPEPVTEMTQVA
jgi:hypothetical protein